VQIDFAFERQNIRTVLTRRQSGWIDVCFHQLFSIVNASPFARIDQGFHIDIAHTPKSSGRCARRERGDLELSRESHILRSHPQDGIDLLCRKSIFRSQR
jgi:hypothetical protein